MIYDTSLEEARKMFSKLIPENKNEILRCPDAFLSAVTVPSLL